MQSRVKLFYKQMKESDSMTVEKLIEKLKEMPPQYIVGWLNEDETDIEIITDVEVFSNKYGTVCIM